MTTELLEEAATVEGILAGAGVVALLYVSPWFGIVLFAGYILLKRDRLKKAGRL